MFICKKLHENVKYGYVTYGVQQLGTRKEYGMRRVVITGGNKGIGLEATKLFLDHGDQVIVIARNFTDFPYADHERVTMIQYDLTQIAGIRKLVEKIGQVDVLINNAGVMNSIPYQEYPKEKMEMLMNLNLYAPIEFIVQVSKGMLERKSGRIVSTASIAGQIGHPDIWYGVSKAGIINATKSFAKQLGADGVIINAVAPGPVETEMMKVIPEARKKAIKSTVYLDRFAKPEEVAQTIYWLGTDSPEYINGTCIDLNNGAFPR